MEGMCKDGAWPPKTRPNEKSDSGEINDEQFLDGGRIKAPAALEATDA
jgi:hypothetical protein